LKSKGGIGDILTAEKNFKHEMLIKFVYGYGLRVSEAVWAYINKDDRAVYPCGTG